MIDIEINGVKYRFDNPKIDSVYLFGSYSRGESDYFSDIDILIVIENDQNAIDLKLKISEELNIPMDWLSVYRIETMEYMASKGSYFLWHIKLEGKLLYSKTNRVKKILLHLNQYQNIEADLREYTIICDDIQRSVELDETTIDYELSLLASVVRNTCIVIAYLDKNYMFGRISPVKYCLEKIKNVELFNLDDYEKLYHFRIQYTRRYSVEDIKSGDINLVKYWLNISRELIRYAKNNL